MLASEFDYPLPAELVAQRPADSRTGARLLVVGRASLVDRTIQDLPSLVTRPALVVLNDTRVIHARLLGHRASGGKAEIFLLRPVSGYPIPEQGNQEWLALGRASNPLREGTRVQAGGIELEVLSRESEGLLRVRLCCEGPLETALRQHGRIPLPPYIRRDSEPNDTDRYQTVYSSSPGSVAAPTAGLHLTEDLLAALELNGIKVGRLTLHVGLGTFRPVSAVDLDDHRMHAEEYCIGEALAEQVSEIRREGGRVVAVGTTVVRALESASEPARPGHVRAGSGVTQLLIQPGYRFRIVDALLTNFHQPRSTLLALVAAFVGLSRVKHVYQVAMDRKYRFLSFGDAMWVGERAC